MFDLPCLIDFANMVVEEAKKNSFFWLIGQGVKNGFLILLREQQSI
jgi:hypothetical protein